MTPRGEAPAGDASSPATTSPGAPRRRAVLLGASNLTRGISTVVATAGAYWGRPLEIVAALGHGRSYGMHSSVFGRRLPGILQCGLWQALQDRPAVLTAAVVTDIGNDLLYDVPPQRIADWVKECLDRLLELDARIVLTRLPPSIFEGVSPWRFNFLKSCFFPSCHLGLDEVLRRADRLDRELETICAERGIPTAVHRREWYGFDPIHVKLRHWRAAWGEILSPWHDGQPLPEVPRPARRRWLYLRRLTPQQRWLFGISRRCPQPSGELPDGSTVALY